MDFIDDIKKETLVICSESVKKMILKRNILKPIKFISLDEFKNKFLFSYDEDAIIYVMNKYHFKYAVSREYIENIYYVSDKTYGIEKLDFLVNLKKELNDNGLLIYNENFKDYAKRTPIIIYNIRLDKYLANMFEGLHYKVINKEYKKYSHKIYEFDTMEDEIWYVSQNIASLIDSGIKPDKIKLMNVDKSYYNTIERIFSLFNLKSNIRYKSKLSSYPLVQEFLKNYKEKNINEAISLIDNGSSVYIELVKIINKYLKYDNKDLLIYKIENSYITSNSYDNEIEIVDYLDYISSDDEYVFMVGFNDSLMPKNQMDTNYITDSICDYVLLDSTRQLNRLLREKTISIIDDIKNLTITYKLSDFKRSYYPSTLCANYEVIKGVNNYKDSYSYVYDKIRLVKKYDEYFKYGYKTPEFDVLNSNYQINYNSYSNKFTGINRIMDKLTLSYSKMQTYNKCAFRYYLANILKLDIYEENFSTVIGSMVHYVMEKCLSNNNMEIDKYVCEFLGDRIFTKKEKFFLEKYKESIKELLDQVMLEREYSLFNQAMYEKKIDIDYGNNIHFVGIIDKVLYYVSDDTTYVSLIDYKTGRDDISLKYLEYGLNIQLPIYLYLSTKLDFKNVKYPGFYLQRFNISEKDYRLIGYSNSNKDTLSVIDKNYDDSKIIKGLKTVSDGGFSKNSKILSDEDIEKVKDIAQEQIGIVIDKIKNNHFEINPKVSEGKNIGCEYCQFKDICFMTKKDEVNIYPQEFGGEI